MKRAVFSIMIAGVALALAGGPARGADEKDQLVREVHDVNRAAKAVGTDVALQRISTETGVPLERVQAMHKRHPGVSIASLMLSTVMADETKKEPEYFLKQRIGDEGWTSIARENKVSVANLAARLDRLEKAIGPAPTSDKTTKPSRRH